MFRERFCAGIFGEIEVLRGVLVVLEVKHVLQAGFVLLEASRRSKGGDSVQKCGSFSGAGLYLDHFVVV